MTNNQQHGARAISPLPLNTIVVGDALTELRKMPSASIDCVVSSPPYFRLRRYGVDGEIGQEPTVSAWVEEIVAVCDELARVLTPTGTLWLNVGDSYSTGDHLGAPPKSLLLGPQRLALRLVERGWRLRSHIVWHKPNGMPSSVRDRFGCKWETVFLLTRSRSYHFDLDAVRVAHKTAVRKPGNVRTSKYGGSRPAWAGSLANGHSGLERARAEGRVGHPAGANPGDVWSIPTAAFRGAHYATFPTRLAERAIRAGCPLRVCSSCTRPWSHDDGTWTKRCECDAGWRIGRVLDCFMGAGTVALVAEELGRDWVGVELNPRYRELALGRIASRHSVQVRTDDGAAA